MTWLWRWILMLGMLGTAVGHDIEMVRVLMITGEEEWVGHSEVDALMLLEIAAGGEEENEEDGTNGWYAGVSEERARKFFEWTEDYWRERLLMTLGGEVCEFEVGLPDPVVLQGDVQGNPLEPLVIKVTLTGKFPKRGGDLVVTWREVEKPYLIMSMRVEGEGGTENFFIDVGKTEKLAERSVPEEGRVVTEVEDLSLWEWVKAGFEHILPKGLDHILFVLGLFLLAPRWKPLLAQSAAFTVAHSITLALVVTGVFSVSGAIVEPLIALSIAYVAVENLFVKELKPWRLGLVFALGLLHGMGFAGVMMELEIPEGQVLEPLLGFNVGVELGQVAVLGLAFLVTCWCLGKEKVWGKVRMVSSLLIAVTGLYWTVERVVG